MKNKPVKKMIIYQAANGAIGFRGDPEQETVWGTQQQIADLFNVRKPAVSKHLKHIYQEGELEREATVSILETVQKEGGRQVTRKIEYYNLDAILSVGYRVNSRQATQFRIWATETLKQHLLRGYTVNRKRISQNYTQFMRAVADVKALLPTRNKATTEDVVELISAFADTWFSLDAYDKGNLPKSGAGKKQITFTAEELGGTLAELKKNLIKKKEATALFGQEREHGALAGIVANVFQSAFGQDAYPTREEKAAHLLYFIVKNHPFADGNKRSGACAFVWFLRKAGLLRTSITPPALTALTLLVAESKPRDKDRMTGLIVLLLSTKRK